MVFAVKKLKKLKRHHQNVVLQTYDEFWNEKVIKNLITGAIFKQKVWSTTADSLWPIATPILP